MIITKNSVLKCTNPSCHKNDIIIVMDNDLNEYPTCPSCFKALHYLGTKTSYEYHIINTEEQKNKILELESIIASQDALIKQIMSGRIMRLMTKLRVLINKITGEKNK